MTKSDRIADLLADLRVERMALMAKLDAVDLVLDNLARVYDVPAPIARPARTVRVEQQGEDSDAAGRRATILAFIQGNAGATTLGALRAHTKKMDPKARGNALQQLKLTGRIQRKGNAWVAV